MTDVALHKQAEAVRDFLLLAKDHLNDILAEDHDPETCDICSQYDGGLFDGWSWAAEQALSEYPLEIVHEVGTLLAVVITTGGPHIAIEKDSRWDNEARLQCYWSGAVHTLHDPVFDWAMDYFMPEGDE